MLDLVAAIRCRMTLEPGETTTVDLISGVSGTREACMELVERYQDRQFSDRVLAAAPAHAQNKLDRLAVTAADAQLFQRLASSVIYANDSLRATRALSAQTAGVSPVRGATTSPAICRSLCCGWQIRRISIWCASS